MFPGDSSAGGSSPSGSFIGSGSSTSPIAGNITFTYTWNADGTGEKPPPALICTLSDEADVWFSNTAAVAPSMANVNDGYGTPAQVQPGPRVMSYSSHVLVIQNPGTSFQETINGIYASSNSNWSLFNADTFETSVTIPTIMVTGAPLVQGIPQIIEGQAVEPALAPAMDQFTSSYTILAQGCRPVEDNPIVYDQPYAYQLYTSHLNQPGGNPAVFVFTQADGSGTPQMSSNYINATITAQFTVQADSGPVQVSASQGVHVEAPQSNYGSGDRPTAGAVSPNQEGAMASGSLDLLGDPPGLVLSGAIAPNGTNAGMYLYGWVVDPALVQQNRWPIGQNFWLQEFIDDGYEYKVGSSNPTSPLQAGVTYLDGPYVNPPKNYDNFLQIPSSPSSPNFGDSPGIGFEGNQEVVENSQFFTYLMYIAPQAPGSGIASLPIPIAEIEWTAKGAAQLVNGSWVPLGSTFDTGSKINLNPKLPSDLPSWTLIWN